MKKGGVLHCDGGVLGSVGEGKVGGYLGCKMLFLSGWVWTRGLGRVGGIGLAGVCERFQGGLRFCRVLALFEGVFGGYTGFRVPFWEKLESW